MRIWQFLVLFIAFWSCNSSTQVNDDTDSPDKGTIRISVDESFKPAIDSQIQVYESQHPNAKIIVEYKPEAQCLKDMDSDSTRMIIVSQLPTEKDQEIYQNRLKHKVANNIVAYDAVAFILPKYAKDTTFTVKELEDIFSGKNPVQVIMDGLSATSTVKYVKDSILKGQPFGKNVQAADSSKGVLDYISNLKNTNAIGVIGLSWIGNDDDAEQQSFLGKVKVANVECAKCPFEPKPMVKPYIANMALARYPYIKPIVYQLKENYNGLGRGFCNFLLHLDKGQLIFKRSYLFPAKVSFNIRDMNITDK
jgi:phosphate transport system substrate-binding protein